MCGLWSCWGGGREAGLLSVLSDGSGPQRRAAVSRLRADGMRPKKISREHGGLVGVRVRGCRAPRSPLHFANSRRHRETEQWQNQNSWSQPLICA